LYGEVDTLLCARLPSEACQSVSQEQLQTFNALALSEIQFPTFPLNVEFSEGKKSAPSLEEIVITGNDC
jgi:hypothetical protein